MSASNVQYTECYVYHSTDGINWTQHSGPFPHTQAQNVGANEERTLRQYQNSTRQPDGRYRTYAILIRCYEPGAPVPDSFVEDLRRNYGIFW